MGITFVDGEVTGPTGKSAKLELLVDTGANYTLLPKAVWEAIGLEPKRRMSFSLADGSTIERNISDCVIELEAGKHQTPVVLGEEGDDQGLLGVVTLEEIGLVFDPFRRELRTMTMRI